MRQLDGRAELVVAHMPQAPGKVYEVWLKRLGASPQATDALFGVTAAGSGAVAVSAGLGRVSQVLVASEPRGGCAHPTKPPRCRRSTWPLAHSRRHGGCLASAVGFCTMHDASKPTGLRERLASGTEDKLGKALTDLFENPLVSGTIGRAFDARERAAQAQELALSALNIPTAADIERLTRRLRSVSQRLEGIEDGVHRLNRALADGGVERRLTAMEEQLKNLSAKLAGDQSKPSAAKPAAAKRAAAKPAPRKRATRASKSS